MMTDRFFGIAFFLRWQWWYSLGILLLALPAQAADVRVAIKQGVSQIQIGGSKTIIVRDRAGKKLGEIPSGYSHTARKSGGTIALGNVQNSELWLKPTSEGYLWIGNRWYRGDARLFISRNGVSAINHVDIEDYLYSVVGAEMIASWHIEALKAQAVAARSYALHKQAESRNRSYDVDTTTATQVYKGLEGEASSTQRAVRETAGEVMVYEGKIILAVFHSSSGGHTENVEDIWSSPLPYLRGVADYDRDAPVYQWTKSFSRAELSRLVGGVGTIQSMTPARTTPQGRIVTMQVTGDRETRQVSGAQLRSALGLRSRLFTVSATGSGFIIQGRGFGHGVGLSQWGAKALAEQGYNYRQILGHYYQNAALSRIGG
ncbi:SpoIID/LytB domain-containing protein [Lusitaniella coriacea LEGE 07157]|uniref:SpoIID/LytB domain-containing protein n=1 Tax=Lusitaniella coriacea LEGE 07157 TaxID=945747 RepID=A0A8J7JA38_9CYAN|nr:SpoIID/LytB domain-containing protein [Lusitaniella coriacea]MBE9116010.1 SpoIID/LytB domain-containing protein [Lusitaniella coriacea LEGE 07157]